MEEVQREHSEIFQAIEARNADLASRLAEQHVLNARRRMKSAFASHVMPDLRGGRRLFIRDLLDSSDFFGHER